MGDKVRKVLFIEPAHGSREASEQSFARQGISWKAVGSGVNAEGKYSDEVTFSSHV